PTPPPPPPTPAYETYIFADATISQQAASDMAARFDWRKAPPVVAQVTTNGKLRPALYSMSILVKTQEDMISLRSVGMHTQLQPLFPQDQQTFDGTAPIAVVRKPLVANGNLVVARTIDKVPPIGLDRDEMVGIWVNALVPGPIYNDLRRQMIDQ